MGNFILSLLNALWKGLRMLAEFLLVVVLGLLVAIVFVLPWLIRAMAILFWLGGAFMASETLKQVYGPISEALPTVALWSVPSILAAALPVWLHSIRQLDKIWGSFFLFGALCLGFRSLIRWLVSSWDYSDLALRAAPPLLVIVLVLFESIRLRFLQRSRKGGDAQVMISD